MEKRACRKIFLLVFKENITMNRRTVFVIATLFFACCFIVSGCRRDGLDRVPVEGNITLDRKSVRDGYITFKPQTGTSCPDVSGQIKDGKYRISRNDGPVVGSYTVGIVASEPTGRTVKAPMTGIESPEMKQVIPAEYTGIMGRSSLTATIKKGKNVVNYDLSSAGNGSKK